jgi:hypothetical protein
MHLALLVALDRCHQPAEQVMRNVLGRVGVAHDAVHVYVDIVCEADIQEMDSIDITLLGTRDRRSQERVPMGGLGLVTRMKRPVLEPAACAAAACGSSVRISRNRF